MRTMTRIDEFADITINHNSDWSGIAHVRATFDGARCDFDVPGAELVSGKLTVIPAVPIAVVTRAVAMAATADVAQSVLSSVEVAIDAAVATALEAAPTQERKYSR